jgi:thermospermine synthase
LRDYPGSFDVIIGDLNDPQDGGPCYQLYTKSFYQDVVSSKLNPGGVFVTQSGPAGMLTAPQVFTSIHNTLAASFGKVVPYSCHVPSFVDEWVRCLPTATSSALT